jgi:hypothetical protein
VLEVGMMSQAGVAASQQQQLSGGSRTWVRVHDGLQWDKQLGQQPYKQAAEGPTCSHRPFTVPQWCCCDGQLGAAGGCCCGA